MAQVFQAIFRRRFLVALLLSLIFIAILLVLTRSTELSIIDKINAAIPTIYEASEATVRPTRHVHLVVPANHADANLCKTLVTSMILGYPTANIVNWQVDFNVTGQVSGGSHLGKLFGINNWLNALPEASTDDLVIVTDAYDVWFQLRPEVLLERYFDINRRANERLRSELGQETMEQYGIENSIVFGAQKKCGMQSMSYPYCDIWPESTLPDNVFGDMTDIRQPQLPNPDIFMRPRTLCSGTFVGPVGPLRKLFAKAIEDAKERPRGGSDQQTLTHIFGRQEIWRSFMRLNEKSSSSDTNNETVDQEFGIGIDYENSLGKATVFSEHDLDFIKYSNSTQIDEVSSELGVVPPHLPSAFAADIERSRLPFAEIQTEDEGIKETQWDQVSLFTDMWSGFAPVMIHHNAWKNNSKARRNTWWPKPWYFPHLRPMLDAASRQRNVTMIASLNDQRNEKSIFERVIASVDGTVLPGLGAVSDSGEYLSWGALCNEYDDSIFQDDRGPWSDPE